MTLVKHIALGAFFILIGIGVLIFSYRNPSKSKALEYTNWKGYIAGLALVLFGTLELFGYCNW